MNEVTKSIIRHILTVLGTVVGFIGLKAWQPIIDFITSNLDGVWDAAKVIIGFATALIAFFSSKDRFTVRAAAKK